MQKSLYVILFCSLFYLSCKKQDVHPVLQQPFSNGYLATVQKQLRQQVGSGQFDQINVNQLYVSKQKERWYLRVGIRQKKFSNDFILLQTDSLGNVFAGKYIHLERKDSIKGKYNGMIEISSLDQKSKIRSTIDNGFVTAVHSA